ncbi:MAG: ATP-binding cassette domain-containing protein [Dysgonamonadaceae bacterium]|nr:ATP-binding cassette domain-containing protein [Dysgonamonadaceae bacterium]MDD4728508.1 ATP-binding cassette domain-containing protein [Dysgonamonadaceae bacterium]
MHYVETKDVVKQFSQHLALNKVNIQVPQGSVFGLLGPNGAGKTTLIRIITRITAPDSGEVLLNGRPLSREDIYKIGYLPEERGLYKKMKVGEQAMYLARLKGMSRDQAHIEITKWFKKFDIMTWYNRKVEELSKGMQQKVQFISTIIHNPDLLIFDEPFSGFDPVNAELIKQEMLKLKAEGKTIILSTHNMESVEALCDEIALINKSEVVLQGSVYDLRNQHKKDIYKFRLLCNTFDNDSLNLEVLSNIRYNEYTDVRIKKPTDMEQSQLIKLMLDRYQIAAFEEELPTMNEVFIETVTQ